MTAIAKAEGKLLYKLIFPTLPREQLQKDMELVAHRYRENVRSIIRIAKSRGITVVVIKQPVTTRYPQYTSVTYEEENKAIRDKFERGESLSFQIEGWMLKQHRLMEELEKIAKEERLPIVDNIRIVDQDRRRLASWVHLTPEGNLRLAEALESVIKPYVLRVRTSASRDALKSSLGEKL
jgi:lysophospholipase L1-like esterase